MNIEEANIGESVFLNCDVDLLKSWDGLLLSSIGKNLLKSAKNLIIKGIDKYDDTILVSGDGSFIDWFNCEHFDLVKKEIESCEGQSMKPEKKPMTWQDAITLFAQGKNIEMKQKNGDKWDTIENYYLATITRQGNQFRENKLPKDFKEVSPQEAIKLYSQGKSVKCFWEDSSDESSIGKLALDDLLMKGFKFYSNVEEIVDVEV